MKCKIRILEGISDIQNYGSEYMYSWYSNVGLEWICMSNWTIRLVRFNFLHLRTSICTVLCDKLLCIWTDTLFYNWINKWYDYFCSTRWGFMGTEDDIISLFLFLSYWKNNAYFHSWLWGALRDSPIFLGILGFSGRRTSKCEMTGLIWSNMYQSYLISASW